MEKEIAGAQEALQTWRDHGDALPWARWLADLRNELGDLNGWSNNYILAATSELVNSGLLTQEIEELARESRPLLARLLHHEPWPVPAMWWRAQIRHGKREGRYHVFLHLAIGADNERPNGTREVATALGMLQYINDVNNIWYANHAVPMDASAVTGTHEIRDLLMKLQSLAQQHIDTATNLLCSLGETVDIPQSVTEENHRLRRELSDLRARIDSLQVQILDAYSAGDRDRAPDGDG